LVRRYVTTIFDHDRRMMAKRTSNKTPPTTTAVTSLKNRVTALHPYGIARDGRNSDLMPWAVS
jgi:hypothetical protein